MWRRGGSILLHTKSSKRCQQEAAGWENALSGVIKRNRNLFRGKLFKWATFTATYLLCRATMAGSEWRKETLLPDSVRGGDNAGPLPVTTATANNGTGGKKWGEGGSFWRKNIALMSLVIEAFTFVPGA